MAALEGFAPSINTGDLVVADGMVNGVHVAGATLDASGVADGTAYAVVPEAGGALSIVATIPDGSVAVASCTVTTGTASAAEYTGRGQTVAASG